MGILVYSTVVFVFIGVCFSIYEVVFHRRKKV